MGWPAVDFKSFEDDPQKCYQGSRVSKFICELKKEWADDNSSLFIDRLKKASKLIRDENDKEIKYPLIHLKEFLDKLS